MGRRIKIYLETVCSTFTIPDAFFVLTTVSVDYYFLDSHASMTCNGNKEQKGRARGSEEEERGGYKLRQHNGSIRAA